VSVVVVIQRAMRVRRIILSPTTFPSLQYFSTLFLQWHVFFFKLMNIKRVFWFYLQLLSETFLILRRTERDIVVNVHRSGPHIKHPLFLSVNNPSRNIFYRLSKAIQLSDLMKIRPVVAELFHADGRMDRRMEGGTDRQDEANIRS